ncbi:ABC transporter permease [Paractinoplanes globisporus]|uniref:ABC transporter permease n=1 Tax=Paractinoplanes globisporus TaxID=113565 RepID=A0ABW6W763_9ACTN|nr:ABC transporter permease [Actinoplanes globisporus]
MSPSRFRGVDFLHESMIAVVRHPGRSLLTAVGTVLSAAAFVCTLGLSSTLDHQVSSSFDVRRATEVLVRPEQASLDPAWQDGTALARLTGLHGVVAAGARLSLDGDRTVQRSSRAGDTEIRTRIIGADSGALRVMSPSLTAGRYFDGFIPGQAERVVMLPRSLARELGITRTQVAVFIGAESYTVIGIYDDVARRPEALQAILMPLLSAEELRQPGGEDTRDVVIETQPGAAQLIGGQAALAMLPTEPQALRAVAPPDPRLLRQEIEGNVARSSLLISVIALVIGAVSIANATTAGIAARTQEIGLRRAVGARRRHVFVQLLGETTTLGLLGGVLGAFLGVCLTLGISLANRWVPVIDLRTALLASGICAGAGLLAGFVPAIRALRIQPVAALQR